MAKALTELHEMDKFSSKDLIKDRLADLRGK
jgi:hypothetical protein